MGSLPLAFKCHCEESPLFFDWNWEVSIASFPFGCRIKGNENAAPAIENIQPERLNPEAQRVQNVWNVEMR